MIHLSTVYLQMGRKLPLTVHKRRSNERQKIKERKLQILKAAEEARTIKYVYGGSLYLKGKPFNLMNKNNNHIICHGNR